jgi:hypothetical protein
LIDAEKAYVEGCALLVIAATIWRFKYGQRTARFGRGRLAHSPRRHEEHEGSRRKQYLLLFFFVRLRVLGAFVVAAPKS